MSTVQTWQTTSSSSAATSEIGELLGRACKGGEIFVLSSDLGGGKTTLTKGLALGLDCEATVNSPTFMVERVYPCRQGISLHHFDFYRLAEGGMVALELQEVLEDSKAIIVVEWGEVVAGILPLEHIRIEINRISENEDSRTITVSCPQKYTYVLEAAI